MGAEKQSWNLTHLPWKCPQPPMGIVPLQECTGKNTEFVWELEQFCEARCK